MSSRETNVQFFHLHIPKTAGKSLNTMFLEAFGSDFQMHELTSDAPVPTKKYAAAHRCYRWGTRNLPSVPIITIIRDPKKRLLSEVSHHMDRRNRPRYQEFGTMLHSRLDGNTLSIDEELYNHTKFRQHCDNLMVRYMTEGSIIEKVGPDHLQRAIDNICRIEYVLMNDQFDTQSVSFFKKAFNIDMVAKKENKGLSTKNNEITDNEYLDEVTKFDAALYEFARKRFS